MDARRRPGERHAESAARRQADPCSPPTSEPLRTRFTILGVGHAQMNGHHVLQRFEQAFTRTLKCFVPIREFEAHVRADEGCLRLLRDPHLIPPGKLGRRVCGSINYSLH